MSSWVVWLIAPLPEAEADDVAREVAPRLGLARDRLASLLSREAGPITRPVPRETADRIARILEGAGAAVHVELAEAPDPPKHTPPQAWMEGDGPEVGVVRTAIDDEGPLFDWDQPLGWARWRRPLLLGFLIAALAVFVWLQLSLAPTGEVPAPVAGAEDLYGRGLAAYRGGEFGDARAAWRSAAEAGDSRALYMLGYMSEFGQGEAWSNRRAAGYYREAAERGHHRAQYALGSLYERGLGVPFSAEDAVRWYRAAAHNGHPEAQHRLGLALLQGWGVAQDWGAALAWFERAAEQGVREAEAFAEVLRAVPPEQRSALLGGASR